MAKPATTRVYSSSDDDSDFEYEKDSTKKKSKTESSSSESTESEIEVKKVSKSTPIRRISPRTKSKVEVKREVIPSKKKKLLLTGESSKAIKKESQESLDWNDFWGFKCQFDNVVRYCGEVMRRKFDDYCWKVMKSTPFYHFFHAIDRGFINERMVNKCNKTVHEILKMYNPSVKGFKLNKIQKDFIRLSSVETSVVFGIKMGECEVDETDKLLVEEENFYDKIFLDGTKVTRTQLREAIEAINEKRKLSNEDKVDLVKLVILYSFSGLFFSSTSGYVPKDTIKSFNSIKSISEECWPRLITEEFKKKLNKFSDRLTSVQGCIYLVLYMLVEHADVIKPEFGRTDRFPRMVKWDLSKLRASNWSEIKERLKYAEVKVKVAELSETEKQEIMTSDFEDSSSEFEEISEAQEEKEDREEVNHLDDLCDAAIQAEGDMDEGKRKKKRSAVSNEEDVIILDEKKSKKKKNKEKEAAGKKKISKKNKDLSDKEGRKNSGDKKRHDKKRKEYADVEEKVVDRKGKAKVSDNLEYTQHMLNVIPNDDVNKTIEDFYSSDKLLKDVEGEPERLKYLLRREKTFRDKLTMKVNFLENALKLRVVNNPNDEILCLVKELELAEKTYTEALELYEIEYGRMDLSVADFIRRNEKMAQVHKQTVEEMNEELNVLKKQINEKDLRNENQLKIISSSREREIKLMKEISLLKKKIEEEEQHSQHRYAVLEEKVKQLENEKGENDSDKQIVIHEANQNQDKVNEMQDILDELKRNASESLQLYQKLKEDTDKVIHEKDERIDTLILEKGRIIERYKPSLAAEKEENKKLKAENDELKKLLSEMGGPPVAAIPIKAVKGKNESDDQAEPKESKLSGLKTRGQRRRDEDKSAVKEPVSKRQRMGKAKEEDVNMEKSIVVKDQKKKNKANMGSDEEGALDDPRKSPYWGVLDKKTQEKLLEICDTETRLTQVWFSEHPSEIDKVTVAAVCLEDIYMDRYISAEIIDWYLIYCQKSYACTTSQEKRTIALRAQDYENVRKSSTKEFGINSIRTILDNKLLGGERYVLAPMLSTHDHWTLLYLDVEKMQWHHYNSLGGKRDRMLQDFKAAQAYRRIIEKYMKPIFAKLLNVGGVEFHKDIIRHEEPVQTNAVDCGVYVCLYGFRLAINAETKFDEKDASQMRGLWTEDILSNDHYSFDKSRPFDPVQSFWDSPAGRIAAEEDRKWNEERARQEQEKKLEEGKAQVQS